MVKGHFAARIIIYHFCQLCHDGTFCCESFEMRRFVKLLRAKQYFKYVWFQSAIYPQRAKNEHEQK
jgi:hypothetical protein